jgi:hypothetical protein
LRIHKQFSLNLQKIRFFKVTHRTLFLKNLNDDEPATKEKIKDTAMDKVVSRCNDDTTETPKYF